MATSWSFSKLGDFEKCRKYFWLKHEQKAPEPERPLKPGQTEHANDRGSRVHDEAVQASQRLLLQYGPDAQGTDDAAAEGSSACAHRQILGHRIRGQRAVAGQRAPQQEFCEDVVSKYECKFGWHVIST